MNALSNRIVQVLAAISLLIATACVPAAPSPTVVPTKPIGTPVSATAAATVPAAKPAEPKTSAAASPAAKAAVKGDWQAEWDKVLAAARQEGKVVVSGSSGDLYVKAAANFQKAYPEIALEFIGGNGATWAPKIIAEREAGRFLWDLYLGGAQTANLDLKPRGVLDSLLPAMILPEVVDKSKWFVPELFMDKEGQYVYGFGGGLMITIFINREFVLKSELSSHDQLVDPKLKGKIIAANLTQAGGPSAVGAYFLRLKGEDWLRRFYSNVEMVPDERLVVEAGVRGRQPLMVGVNRGVYQTFAKEGLTKSLEPLDPDAEISSFLSTGPNHVALINKAPHPNAAKVFINWLLSKEGQQAWVDVTDVPSMRVDVKGGDPMFSPKPGVKYSALTNHENFIGYNEKAFEIAREMFR